MNRLRRTQWAALALERRLEASGRYHFVVRVTRPRSPIHVVAVGPSGILLCQVTTSDTTRSGREQLQRLSVPTGVTKRLCRYRQGGWTELTLP